MNLHLVFVALMLLTGATAWTANSASSGDLALMILGGTKLLLVAFFFMDLREAHLSWKAIVVTFIIAFTGISFVIHAY
mgnify:CR=1 FL=1